MRALVRACVCLFATYHDYLPPERVRATSRGLCSGAHSVREMQSDEGRHKAQQMMMQRLLLGRLVLLAVMVGTSYSTCYKITAGLYKLSTRLLLFLFSPPAFPLPLSPVSFALSSSRMPQVHTHRYHTHTHTHMHACMHACMHVYNSGRVALKHARSVCISRNNFFFIPQKTTTGLSRLRGGGIVDASSTKIKNKYLRMNYLFMYNRCTYVTASP